MKQPLGIRELAEQAKRDGAFDLAQGVIDAPPPQILIQNLKKLPLELYSTYNNKRGVIQYREAIQQYLISRKWPLALEQIMAVAGAMGGITSALLTTCHSNDTILIPEPFFGYHKQLVQTLGFQPKFIPVPLDTQPDWTELEKQMHHAKAFILTTPANPTGQVASAAVLQRLSEVAEKSGCLLILDEMYREFMWHNEPLDDHEYQNLNFKNTVLIRSFSKTFSIPGWRVGFAVTSPERMEKMATIHDLLYIGGSTIAQHAIAKSLSENLNELNQYVSNLRTRLTENKLILSEAFKNYGMSPLDVPATYYMLIKHHRNSDLEALEELIKKKIVVTPLNIMYSNSAENTGYIRIHFALTPDNTQKVRTILSKK